LMSEGERIHSEETPEEEAERVAREITRSRKYCPKCDHLIPIENWYAHLEWHRQRSRAPNSEA
jgi:hypothetical protein